MFSLMLVAPTPGLPKKHAPGPVAALSNKTCSLLNITSITSTTKSFISYLNFSSTLISSRLLTQVFRNKDPTLDPCYSHYLQMIAQIEQRMVTCCCLLIMSATWYMAMTESRSQVVPKKAYRHWRTKVLGMEYSLNTV